MLNPPLPRPTDLAIDPDATRRAFLKKVAVGGAAAAIGTQVLPLRAFAQEGGPEDGEAGGGEEPTSDTTEPGTQTESEEPASQLTADEQRLTYLAGIGLAAATLYRAATGDESPGGGSAAEEGDEEGSGGTASATTTTTLPPIEVPPLAEPVVEVLRAFGSHHSQQSTGLNALLAVAVAVPNATLVSEVRSSLAGAADEAAVLEILRDLEERIAATHLQAIADLEDANDAMVVATALPVISQHAVVLGRIGATPTPFEDLIPEQQTTDGALDEGAYPGEFDPQDTPGEPSPEEPETSGGGEGADPDTGTETNPDDGATEQSGGGADGGGSTDSGGSAADPESEG